MATYITPVISRREFDDWYPGRGLDTVTATAMFIRDYYGVSRVWLIQTPKGVQFKVSGSTQSVREFAALYGA